MEALLQQAELDRYHTLEGERRKWEERESHLFAQLGATELQTVRTTAEKVEHLAAKV